MDDEALVQSEHESLEARNAWSLKAKMTLGVSPHQDQPLRSQEESGGGVRLSILRCVHGLKPIVRTSALNGLVTTMWTDPSL